MAHHFRSHIAKQLKGNEADVENRESMKRVRNKMERRPTLSNNNYEDIMV